MRATYSFVRIITTTHSRLDSRLSYGFVSGPGAHQTTVTRPDLFRAYLTEQIGNGVAIPHVRLEQVKKPFGIMARLRHPIDFNAVDGQAVDLVCMVLLSKENDGAQLNALAGVARRLRLPDVLDDLRRAPNRVVLYNVMIGRTGQYQSE